MAYGTLSADVINTSVGNSSLGAGNSSLLKNRLINGAMILDQYAAGIPVTPTTSGYVCLDQWKSNMTQPSKFQIGQNLNSINPPSGFNAYLGVQSTSSYSILVGDAFYISQPIEGYYIADLDWGTANAKPVTLSFQVYCTQTGNFGGSITNHDNSRAYAFIYNVPVANLWTTIEITITGDTSGVWLLNNNIGAIVNFGLGVGATNSKTAGSWGTGALSATGAVSVVGTNAARFNITDVQLEVGEKATGYEYTNIQKLLLDCYRYYQVLSVYEQTVPTSWSFAAPMRQVPTMTSSGAAVTPAGSGFIMAAGTAGIKTVTASAVL